MNNTEEGKLKVVVDKILKQANLLEDQQFGSIIGILMMISIVLTMIRILQECNKNKLKELSGTDKYALYGEQIKTFSRKRGWFTRMRLKKVLRNKLSPDAYAKYSTKLIEAILDVGEKLTDDEVITLVEASNV